MERIDSVENLHRQLLDILETVSGILEAVDVPLHLAAGTALGAARDRAFIPWDFDVDTLLPLEHYERACAALEAALPDAYAISWPRNDRRYEHLFARVYRKGPHHKYVHLDLFPLVPTAGGATGQSFQLGASRVLRKAFYLRQRSLTKNMPDLALYHVAGWFMRRIPHRAFSGGFWWLGRMFDRPGSMHVTNLAAGYMRKECVPARLFAGNGVATLYGRNYRAPQPIGDYLTSLYGDYIRPPSQAQRETELAKFRAWYLPALADVELVELGGRDVR